MDSEIASHAPAARICAVLANLLGDQEKHGGQYTPAEFMPGAEVKSEREKLREWAEAVLSGEEFEEPDAAEMQETRRTIEKTFSNVVSG